MATAKKSAAKKAAAKKKRAPLPSAEGMTLQHIHYHPEAGIVRVNVQQDVTIAGQTERHGRDIDIALDSLGTDIRSALEDAFGWLAEDLGAEPYEAPEPDEAEAETEE